MWIDQPINHDTYIGSGETYSSDYDAHLGIEVGDSVESGTINNTSQIITKIDENSEIEVLPDSPISVGNVSEIPEEYEHTRPIALLYNHEEHPTNRTR